MFGFILDLYCPEFRVNFEIDGKVHRLKKARDEKRDAILRENGIIVIRYSARSILRDPDMVAFQIKTTLEKLQKNRDTSSDCSTTGHGLHNETRHG